MRPSTSPLNALVLAFALALAVSACGSSGSDAADEVTTSVTDAATTDAATTDAATTDTADGGGLGSSAQSDDSMDDDSMDDDSMDDDSMNDDSTTDSTVATEDTLVDPAEQALDVFDVAVGDCFDDFSIGQVSEVTGRSCESPHLYEVYAAFDIPGDIYPGDEEVSTAATDGCLERFEPFVGEPYETSILDISFLTPTLESWTLGDDREVLCMVVNVDETPRVGSAAGVAE